jgi:hypothetical protein
MVTNKQLQSRLVALVALGSLGWSAVATAQPAAPVEPEGLASVSGPTAIGFFPPITEKERDEDDGGLSEGYAHLSFALEDLEKCLGPRKLTVRLKITRSLQVQDGATSYRLEFPADWQHAIGIVLAEPGRKPEVIYATAGPSSLLELAPQAAWKYFSEPKCKRYEE